jgi:uncharacterized protein
MDYQELKAWMTALQAQKKDPTMALLETHGAWIVLHDVYAYKVKKPVNLGFLDFSTLEKRKFFCEEELRLNSRLTNIYLRVIGIFNVNGVWETGSMAGYKDKVPLEFAVQMRRMDPLLQMDNMLHHDKVTNKHIAAIAHQLANFHKSSPPSAQPATTSDLREAFNDIRSVKPALQQLPQSFFSEGIDHMIVTGQQLLQRLDSRMVERNKSGWIRDVHGDVHSGNIFLADPPVIFDCIEFNPDFRAIDVLSEIAFLCMDLERFQRPDLSSLFLNAYLQSIAAIQVPEDEALLHFYKLYRLNIRIKVKTIQATPHLDDPKHQQDYLQKIQPYFSLLKEYIALAEQLCS